jgi:putative membrane protein
MRKQWLIIFALFSLMALIAAGCKKKEETTTGTTDTSTTTVATNTSASSTTSTTATETTGTTSTSTTGTTGTALGVKLSKDDEDFVIKAAEAGNSEVSEGNLAASKATDPDVKSFASTMVTDHGKAGDELKSFATSRGMTLPTGPGKDGEAAMDKLSKKSGTDFDKAYMEQAVKDHEHAVKAFEKASRDAKDPDLKAWAAKTLPTLQHHLELAKAAKKKVG